MPSEVETAAEKVKDVPLMRWRSTTIREPRQNPPDEFRPLVTEPMQISIAWPVQHPVQPTTK